MATSLADAIQAAEVVVIGHRYQELDHLGDALDAKVQIDLVRAYPGRASNPPSYKGICW
jgi:hypothetical protein